MHRVTPHRPRALRSGATTRRAAIAALGVICLAIYALAFGPQWPLPPLSRTDVPAPEAPSSPLVSTAARDLALTPADVAGLAGDIELVPLHVPTIGESGMSIVPGQTGAHSVTFRTAGASETSVWEPLTPANASLSPVLEITSAVSVFRDAATADLALAAWSDRVPGGYRLVAYGPWPLADLPPTPDAPVLASYGGVRPHATVALVSARAANVLATVWVAAPSSPDAALTDTDSVANAAQWDATLHRATALAETVVRRSLASAR